MKKNILFIIFFLFFQSLFAQESLETARPSLDSIQQDNILNHHVYIQMGYGHVSSKFGKVYSALDDGMIINSLRFVRDLNDNIQTGFGLEFCSETSGEKLPDNIRSIQYRFSIEYHQKLLRKYSNIQGIGGLSMAVGNYGLRRRYINGLGEEVSVKISEGILVGLIPGLGFRIPFLATNSLDLLLEYHQYLGNPQKYYSGLGLMMRLNFGF